MRTSSPKSCQANRERRDGDDAVERQEQVRLCRADVHRDTRGHARERRDRKEPRHAQDDPGACDGEDDSEHRGRSEHAVVAVRSEVDRKAGAADRPGRKPGNPQVAPGRDEEQRDPERADRAGGLCEPGAHRDDHRAGRSVPRRGDIEVVGARFARRAEVERPRPLGTRGAVQPPADRRRVGRDAQRERRACATRSRACGQGRRSGSARSRTGSPWSGSPRGPGCDREQVAAG